MVLMVSCSTSSNNLVSPSSSPPLSRSPHCEHQGATTTTTSTTNCEYHQKSQPIPVRTIGFDGHSTTSPLERLPSPLATSAESVDSIKSSCSSRSSAERELERAERRHLLDVSLSKLRGSGQSNMPLRKHLLVFNTVKTLQRDLDQLDDEDLYCSLVGMSNDSNSHALVTSSSDKMEVDECCWMKSNSIINNQASPLHHHGDNNNYGGLETMDTGMMSVVMSGAPPKPEEQQHHHLHGGMIGGIEDFEMEDLDPMGMGNNKDTTTKTWSWSSESSFFDSIEDSKASLPFSWPYADSPMFNPWSPMETDQKLGMDSLWSPNSPSDDLLADEDNKMKSTAAITQPGGCFDIWGPMADPFGPSRAVDFCQLFPSQLLLQA